MARGKRRSRGAAIAKRGASKVVRRLKGRTRKHGVLAGIWLVLASCFAIAWWTTGLTLWGVGSLLAGLASVLSAFAEFDPEVVVSGPRQKKAAKTNPRQNGSARRPVRSPGTAPRKVAGRPRKQVCSARCRESTKSVAHCQCVCAGRSHGTGRKVVA